MAEIGAVMGAAATVLLSSIVAAAEEPLQVTVREPRREYSRTVLPLTCALADSRPRRVGANQTYPYYYNIRSFSSVQRVYRVHVPIEIQARGGLKPRARILYAFRFSSWKDARGEPEPRARSIPDFTRWRWADVVLQPGKHEWHVTSEWMIEADKSLWTGGDDLLVRTRDGTIKIAKRVQKDEQSLGRVIDTFFPYVIHYWATQQGIDGEWLEEEFPQLIVREVRGDEVYDGLWFMIFPEDETLPAVGNMSEELTDRFLAHVIKTWENPYPPLAHVTNRWMERAWMTNVMQLADPGVRVAYLWRQLRSDPTDIDAADLLLLNAIVRGDSEQVARAYALCRTLFPGWKEYWFRQYWSSITDAETKRALLIAFHREEPGSVFALQTLVDMYTNEARYRSARRLLSAWLALQPSNVHAHAALLRLARKEQRPRDAQLAQATIIRLVNPGDCVVTGFYGRGSVAYEQYLRGQNCERAGDTEHALAALRRSTHNDPGYYPALLRSAHLNHQRGVATAAHTGYRAVLAVCSNHPAALRGLACLYQEAGQTRSAQRAQEQLWQALQPVIAREYERQNWTNVANLARYVLDALPSHRAAQLLYAEATTRLGLYDDASATLSSLGTPALNDVDVIRAWARLCRAIDDDPHVLLLHGEPMRWRARAAEAWTAVLQQRPRDPQALYMRALMAVEDGAMQAALRDAEALYQNTRWPAAAAWYAELCLRYGRASRGATLPGLRRKLCVDEAADIARRILDGHAFVAAQPALSLVRWPLATPEAYAVLAEAQYWKDPEKNEASVAVRGGVQRFPAAPVLRALSVSRMLLPQGAPLRLWAPYTNLLDYAAWYDWRVNAALISMYEENALPYEAAYAHLKAALQLLQWRRTLYEDISNREEVLRPLRYYEMISDNGWRFELRRHAFLAPAPAYAWYAIRSRYSESDLKNGATRWWQQQQLAREARGHLRSVYSVQQQNTTWTARVPHVWLAGVRISDATQCDMRPVETLYMQQLRSCFYRDVQPLRERTESFDVRMRLADSADWPAFGAQPLVWGEAAPEVVRRLLAPPTLALRALPAADAAETPMLRAAGWRLVPRMSWNWPAANPAALVRSTMDYGGINATQDANGLRIVQGLSALPTSHWQGVCITPCFAGSAVPLLPSPFDAALSGAVSEVVLTEPERQTAKLSVVLSPFPMLYAMQRSLQEALMLEWTLGSSTTMQARVIVRTPGRENGMPLDKSGIVLAEATLPAGSSLWWRVNGRWCEMGVTGHNALLRAEHGLTRGAWEAGAVVNLHAPAMPQPFTVNLRALSAGVEQSAATTHQKLTHQ